MMMDIFSTFDDHNFVFLNYYTLLWLISFMSMSIVFSFKWMSKGPYGKLLSMLKCVPGGKETTGMRLGGFHMTITALFSLLVSLNLAGLIPYVFSPTAHLSVSFTFGLILWLSLLLSGFIHNFPKSTANLLPTGAPGFLAPFLVLVETVSITVRPITISVRLVANISAGHIILSLISEQLANLLFTSTPILITTAMIEVFYFLFEMGVAVIQGYIFCLLINLYSNEHP